MSVLKVNNIQAFTSGAAVSFGAVSFPSGISGDLNATTLGGQPDSYYRNIANITGAINADTLDNLDSTYFRDGANLTGTINATQLSGQTSAYYRNAANLTGAINATQLDSQVGSYYRNAANITGVYTGVQTFSGTASNVAMVVNDIAEVVTVTGLAAGTTINYDVTTQSVLYYTSNATGNWTINFRGSSGTTLNNLLATGQSVTTAFLATQGATAYYNTTIQVDGSTASGRWQGGTAPTAGNASSIDAYVYTLIKTGNAGFTVLASQTRFA
jgi:hypothetical protein